MTNGGGWHAGDDDLRRAIPVPVRDGRRITGGRSHLMATDSDALTPDRVKQVIVIRRDLKMRRGKEIAQGAHAAAAWVTSLVTNALDPATRSATITIDPIGLVWLTTSHRKITLQAHSEAEITELHDVARARGLRSHLITDSGRTEFGGVPTITALAIGPDLTDLIDEVTGHLTIY